MAWNKCRNLSIKEVTVMSGILEGVKVLDFWRYIAEPFCGALLAYYRAEMIRIERVSGSEDRFVTPVTEDGQGAMLLQLNRNKLGLTLNSTKDEGKEIGWVIGYCHCKSSRTNFKINGFILWKS